MRTPIGLHLLNWEQSLADELTADWFGYHALQMGLPPLQALRQNRMPNRWLALAPEFWDESNRRLRANGLGITERDVTNSMVASLAGSGQVAPNFWVDPRNMRPVLVAVQAPQHRVDNLVDLLELIL